MNNQISRDMYEEGRGVILSPDNTSFQLYQVQRKLNKPTTNNNSNSDMNINNKTDNVKEENPSLELIASLANMYKKEEEISTLFWRYLHGNLVVYEKRTLFVGTFKQGGDASDVHSKEDRQSSLWVELARDIRVDNIHFTRDRLICKLFDNEPPIMFDFTGINHSEERQY